VAVATQLAKDDELAALLACRKLREAVAGTERRKAGARLSTRIGSAFGSVGKLEWAASCGMPLSAKLLTRAARRGQLEHLRWLRAHGCAWEPCERWWMHGGVVGGRGRAQARLKAAICRCCSGRLRMATRGMRKHAHVQLRVGIWPCTSGLVRMAVGEMRARASMQLRVGICPCSSGLMRMAARGMRARASMQLRVGICPCCSGPVRMAARGMRSPALLQLGLGI
jgi:hypothetical protein